MTLLKAHPLTRAAAGFHLWRGFGLGTPERICEPIVIAARLAGAMAQGGVTTVATVTPEINRTGTPGTADRLQQWCLMVRETKLRFQRHLDDLDVRRERAEAAVSDLNGSAPARLIALFENRPVLSAKDCATALSRTPTQTRQILNAFEN